MTQGPFQCLWIGRVDLEWQISDTLHSLDRRIENGWFVKSGNANIDVKYMRTRISLRNRLAQQV